MTDATTSPSPIIIEGVPPTSTDRLVAWWYCSIKKNPDAVSESKVEVCFRQLLDREDEYVFRHHDVGITHLGQVRLGTIWQGQKKVGQIPLSHEIFQVDFSDGAWGFSGAWDKENQDATSKKRLIPPFIYKLDDATRHPKTRLVEFHLTDNPHGLIVPCLEVFSRLYGRSQYLKRVLLAKPFDQAINELIVPDIEEAPPNTWQVTVDKHCYDGDGVFLAHLKHDPLSARRVRSIWGQTEGAQNTSGNIPAYPEIGPWFAGPAQLRVRGKWLDNEKKKFLALEILGCSDPGGAEIYFDRENTNMVTGPLKKVRGGGSWPRVKREKPTGGKDIHITHLKEPGAGEEPLEIADPFFEILGQPRLVTKIVRSKQGDREKRHTESGEPTDQYSGGEAHGSGGETAPVSIAAPQILEAKGLLRDVWDVLVRMAADKNEPIKSVTSILPDGAESPEPKMLTCPAAEFEPGMTDSKLYWHLLTLHPEQPRNILVARIKTENEILYIVEIQRRIKITEDGRQEESPTYRGMAFRLDDESGLSDWLKAMLKEVVRETGIVYKITNKCPGTAATFKHLQASKGGLKRSIMNGLSKVMADGKDNSTDDGLYPEA